MQCQLMCTKLPFCDFIMWTQKDIHIERVYPDESFWITNIDRASLIFKRALMPEIIGRFFSRPSAATSQSSSAQSAQLVIDDHQDSIYCYCQNIEDGEMIGCDNQNCQYKWFHLRCVYLDKAPKSKLWYCPDCRKLPEFKNNNKAKSRH